jgi:hypothetical protein
MQKRWMAMVGAGLLLLPACGGGDDGAFPEATATTVADGGDATTTTGVPEIETTDAGIDLPRGFTYSHVVFEVTEAEFSNATPGTYLDDEPEVGEEQLLYVSFTAEYESGYPGVSEQYDVDMFQIVTGADRTIAASGVDFASSMTVSGRTRTEVSVAFPVDPEDLDGGAFRLDDGVHEPAEVPLDGAVPTDPYPVAITVTGEGAVTYEGGCADATGTFRIVGAEWDVDSGIDGDSNAIVTNGTKRTVAGERFLRIRVQAIAASGTCGGTIVSADHFRLNVDGLPIRNDNVRRSELLANGEGREFVWGYRVPVDAAALVLEVGTEGGTVVQVPLPPPAELP